MFKNYFNSVADIIEARHRGHSLENQNNADKGELCEIFIRDFLKETLGDSYKIGRGGKIIDRKYNFSKQLDIILTAKKSLKLFHDKGVFPVESVYGVISVTSTLNKGKLLDCCNEFLSIPKYNPSFYLESYLNKEYVVDTIKTWTNILPYKVIFAFDGELKPEWIDEIIKVNRNSSNFINTLPDLVIVNKKSIIEKSFVPEGDGLFAKLKYTSFSDYPYYGVPFAKMIYHLNNAAHEEHILKYDLGNYFNQDL